MKILLVEPDYKNKYPPIGLMKISTYHKNKGDYIYFHKGIYKCDEIWDRIYITTLFTFDYANVIKTINYYKDKVNSLENLFVGGILASLMAEDLKSDTDIQNIIKGQLTSSDLLGFNDNINIDALPIDYDILSDTDYSYPASKSFIAYTTRGCINKCFFCAVPELEGPLSITNNISKQITTLRNQYGDKKDLMLLDNNILGVSTQNLEKIVSDLNNLGFINEKTYTYPNEIEIILTSYYRYLEHGKSTLQLMVDCKKHLYTLLEGKRISKLNKERLSEIIDYLEDSYDFFDALEEKYNEINSICSIYRNKIRYQRYVDFNQGLDAREFTEEKISILSRLPLKPCRIAFDNIDLKAQYIKALTMAHNCGINYFSNYLLYNADFDKPEDLYLRLEVNIEIAEKFENIHLFSFPMKYAPIDKKDRLYVGKNWNKHYLRSIQAIINVTKGVVTKGRSFFKEAFGSNLDEYFNILAMPHDFIIYRNYYKAKRLTDEWLTLYSDLSTDEKKQLLELLSNSNYTSDNNRLGPVLKYYQLPYKYEQLNANSKYEAEYK